jgi:hypothetical protein
MNSYFVNIVDRRTGAVVCEQYVEADTVAEAKRIAMSSRLHRYYETGDVVSAD